MLGVWQGPEYTSAFHISQNLHYGGSLKKGINMFAFCFH